MTLRNILVADEDADTRVILRTVLERQDFAVIEAANGDQAFAASQLNGVELVILNYPMTCSNSQTLARRLRESAITAGVPILNLTSRVVPKYLFEAAAEGVDVSVGKPVDVAEILKVVNNLTTGPRAIPAH